MAPSITLVPPGGEAWRNLDAVQIPRWVPVRQQFDAPREADIVSAVRHELTRPEISKYIRPGLSVALGVGSRGLASLQAIVATAVDVFKEAGCYPFIVPAMGSHGGATAEGQAATLAELDITEATVGAPVCSSMDVVKVGNLSGGAPIYFDRLAMGADLVVPINRVKPHTSFHGAVESGLAKMLAVGLSKHAGAVAMHAEGFAGISGRIAEALPLIQANTPFRFGLATIENARHEVASISALLAEGLLERESVLLQDARSLMSRLLFARLDVLVVGEIGKDVSGTGMDPNVTGRSATGERGEIDISRIVALRLTEHTGGNAIGLGMADVTTERVVRTLDLHSTWINALTSTNLTSARLPIFMPSDRLAIAAALQTCGNPDPSQATIAWIRNTLSLEDIWVSEPLWNDLASNPRFAALGEAREVPFTDIGDLIWT